MNAPFFWGQGGQKLTPGQAKAMRDVASAIAAKKQTPQNLGEGLASVGDALLYNSNVARAGEAESAGQAQVAQALAEARASGGSDGFLDVMGNEWASPAQQMVAGELYKRAQPEWQTFESGGDRYRYNSNASDWTPEQFFDGPETATTEDMPSTVREWEYFNALGPEDQDAYLRMKRSIPYLDTGTGYVQPDPTNPGAAAGPAIVKDNFTQAYDQAAGTAGAKVDVENQAAVDSLESKLPGLKAVVSELSGLAQTATYTQTGQLIDNVMRETGMEPSEAAVARTKYIAMVDNQVLPLLRDVFGAAFTVKEGETLRATLGDPNKSPAEKQVILEAFIEQKTRDLEALKSRVPGASAPAGADDVDAILSGMGI